MKCRGFFPRAAGLATLLATGVLNSPEPEAQSLVPGPAFEVASVKPNRSGRSLGTVVLLPGGRFTATNVPLRQLISVGYELLNMQIVGGPNWIGSDRFDITTSAEGNPPRDQIGLMIRRLLADRFALVAHRETRELPVFALLMARNDGRLGPQLRQSQVDCAAVAAARAQAPPVSPQPGGRLICDQFGSAVGPRFSAGGVTMTQLATRLAPQVRRMVVDRTDLLGTFDFELQWTPEGLPPRAPGTPADQPLRLNGTDVDPNGPSIFTALREQLGLSLDSQEGPVEVLVIDSASQPTPD